MNIQTVGERIRRAGETTGSYNSPESNLASSGIRAMLKKAFPDCALIFSKGHFYCSGFIEKRGKFVFFSFSDYRFFGDSAYVRTATGPRDFTGGPNISANSQNLVRVISETLTRSTTEALSENGVTR